jgi:hypothetical protein
MQTGCVNKCLVQQEHTHTISCLLRCKEIFKGHILKKKTGLCQRKGGAANNTNYIVVSAFLLTYSMEQSPSWEANSKLRSYSRNSQHLWNPKVPHCTHKCPPPVPFLSQLHPVPTTPSNFLMIHLNIILPSRSWSPQWPLSLWLPLQHPVHTSILPHTWWVLAMNYQE